ncbi:MAG TPA: DUF1223 domain-containing protein [Xanthobacteraceae bacterium]
MTARRYVAFGAIVATLAAGVSASAAEPRAVIELFTSQGCSSCPAADKLLGDLGKDPTLIPLTLSIDLWDYLGWKDTLALPGHSKRQRAYSHSRGDREVYTPQAVINGTVQALGSDPAAIESAITQSRRNAATLSLPLTLTVANGRLTVAAPDAKSDVNKTDTSADVWLCPLSKTVEVAIGRGENSGHSITYHNVVRKWVKLGVWSGKAQTWSIPVGDFKTEDVNAVAVILQNGGSGAPGAMLGAAMASLDDTLQAPTAQAKP